MAFKKTASGGQKFDFGQILSPSRGPKTDQKCEQLGAVTKQATKDREEAQKFIQIKDRQIGERDQTIEGMKQELSALEEQLACA